MKVVGNYSKIFAQCNMYHKRRYENNKLQSIFQQGMVLESTVAGDTFSRNQQIQDRTLLDITYCFLMGAQS